MSPINGILREHMAASSYLVYLIAAVACLLLAVRLHRDSDRYDRQDFDRYFADAQLLSQGGNPWRVVAVPKRVGIAVSSQIAYPPAFYFMFSPLCRLRPSTAHWVWEYFQIVFLTAALTILLYEIGAMKSGDFKVFAFAFAYLFPPLHSALHWGQPTTLLLLLLVGSWASERHGRDISAGVLLSLATLLKVFPLVVGGYFLFRGRSKVLASALLFAITVSAGLIALYGTEPNFDFVRGTRVSAIWLDRATNLSLIGNLHSVTPAMTGAGRDMTSIFFGALAASAGLLVLGVSGILTSRLQEESAQTSGLCWSLWVISSIVLSPVAWDHYLVLVIPMYILLAWQSISDVTLTRQYRPCGITPLIGLALVAIGLLGFFITAYYAAARHMHLYLILVLASYAGLCLLLRRFETQPIEAAATVR